MHLVYILRLVQVCQYVQLLDISCAFVNASFISPNPLPPHAIHPRSPLALGGTLSPPACMSHQLPSSSNCRHTAGQNLGWWLHCPPAWPGMDWPLSCQLQYPGLLSKATFKKYIMSNMKSDFLKPKYTVTSNVPHVYHVTLGVFLLLLAHPVPLLNGDVVES